MHSSRGGTGKTTIATNLAMTFTRKGFNVALLDLDFRAPSLYNIFSKTIQKTVKNWLNDFLLGHCTLEQSLIDVSKEYETQGKLLIGPANPAIKAIRNMMGRSRSWEVNVAKKLFSIRKPLFEALKMDFCILDTSPGIQYSSINGVVSSDVAIIVTTLDSLDVENVKNMIGEFYDEFEKKSVVLMNKIFPQPRAWPETKKDELMLKMEKEFGRPIIGMIPCYCDVLEFERNSLLLTENPDHQFLKDLQEVAKKLEKI